ncbi:MAG TPA: polyhydroxyalkanoic acid system family protein [Polyangiaceae bacterium]|nr:polyhydroxyalkanoic acid system family protein [Polyangiaceae bacterium]
MKHSVTHGLSKDVAKQAVVAAFESYSKRFSQYRPTANWVTPDRAEVSFSAKGITLSGTLEVQDRTVEMDLDVPFLLRPFKDKALGAVEREIGVWVEKAKRGEV